MAKPGILQRLSNLVHGRGNTARVKERMEELVRARDAGEYPRVLPAEPGKMSKETADALGIPTVHPVAPPPLYRTPEEKERVERARAKGYHTRYMGAGEWWSG